MIRSTAYIDTFSLYCQLIPLLLSPLYDMETYIPLQMLRHNLAQHMQEFTQMHMRYMADFLRGLILNGTTTKSLCSLGSSASPEDQGAAASASALSGPRGGGCSGSSSSSSNCAPCQPSEEMQRLREMDGRLVKQDHQLRELIILKDTQVLDDFVF